MPEHAYVSSERYIDSRVQNCSNEPLGHVKELIIDSATGHIEYVLVACGGHLGFGSKLVAVPWAELRTTFGDQVLIWDKSAHDIETLPEAEPRAWAHTARPDGPFIG